MSEQQALDEQFAQQVTLDEEQAAQQVTEDGKQEVRKCVSFFSKDKHYLPIPEDRKIHIIPFLEKTSMIVEVFDVFGVIFSPVKKDMQGNIKKLRDVYDRDPERFVTLDDMLDYEIETKDKKRYAIVSGVWLGRGLEFMQLFFQSLVEEHDENNLPEESLTNNLKSAYEKSLKVHHNMVSKAVFTTVAHAAPYRTDLLKGLLTGLTKKEIEALPKQQVHNMIFTDIKPYMKIFKENTDAWKQAFVKRNLQHIK